MGEGRIPWLAAHQYAKAQELSDDEFEDLWALISVMDAEYLAWQNKKQENSRRNS